MPSSFRFLSGHHRLRERERRIRTLERQIKRQAETELRLEADRNHLEAALKRCTALLTGANEKLMLEITDREACHTPNQAQLKIETVENHGKEHPVNKSSKKQGRKVSQKF